MEKFRFNYEYENLEKGERQYRYNDFASEKMVEAKYVPAVLECDKGNPFIESLPYPRTKEECEMAYYKPWSSFDRDAYLKLDTEELKIKLNGFRLIRFPLLYQRELEFRVYDAITNSYRSRYFAYNENANISVFINQKEEIIHGKLLGDETSAANVGFSLTGFSGVGKTSSLKAVLDHYPQVIVHKPAKIPKYPQVVYLLVNCSANSNFSALYDSIGEALDRALGNVEPIYQDMIHHISGLARKAAKVREWVEKYAIGLIILDEVQLINFKSTKENSFESFLVLNNQTKVAIGVVGTEESTDLFTEKLRTKRRIGAEIRCNRYCDNKKHFTYVVRQLFKYQLFEPEVKVTNEIVETLHKLSRGIIDQLVSIYMIMHYEYLLEKDKPYIDSIYITKVVDKYFKDMQELLVDVDKIKRFERLLEEKNKEKYESLRKQEEEAEKEILESENSPILNLKTNVIKNILSYDTRYNEEMISNAFDKVFNIDKNKGKNEITLTMLTLDQLKREKTYTKQMSDKRKKTKKKTSHQDMKKFLNK